MCLRATVNVSAMEKLATSLVQEILKAVKGTALRDDRPTAAPPSLHCALHHRPTQIAKRSSPVYRVGNAILRLPQQSPDSQASCCCFGNNKELDNESFDALSLSVSPSRLCRAGVVLHCLHEDQRAGTSCCPSRIESWN